MDESRSDDDGLGWKVDQADTIEELTRDLTSGPVAPDGGGRVVYRDREGRQFRLPADLSELSDEERGAALKAMTAALEALPRDDARAFALQHLDRVRASGRMSDEAFYRERLRLLNY